MLLQSRHEGTRDEILNRYTHLLEFGHGGFLLLLLVKAGLVAIELLNNDLAGVRTAVCLCVFYLPIESTST